MRTLTYALLVALFGSSITEGRQDDQARPSFFDRKAVDFWRDGSAARADAAPPAPAAPESIWAEPIRLPDGRYTTYLPPRPVLEFLERPTRENARKYLDWQSARMDKMRKAAALLTEMQREKASRTAKAEVAVDDPVTVTYFKKAG